MINAILTHVANSLQQALITDIPAEDPTRAGYVKVGPYQGDPAPDTGRITVSVHENDPDRVLKAGVTGFNDDWSDSVDLVECGAGSGIPTTTRRFTIKARCLFTTTRESENDARSIASTIRSRIENTLRTLSFATVRTANEYVARGAVSEDLAGEMVQSGGPPDAFDYLIKVHFSVLTTQIG